MRDRGAPPGAAPGPRRPGRPAGRAGRAGGRGRGSPLRPRARASRAGLGGRRGCGGRALGLPGMHRPRRCPAGERRRALPRAASCRLAPKPKPRLAATIRSAIPRPDHNGRKSTRGFRRDRPRDHAGPAARPGALSRRGTSAFVERPPPPPRVAAGKISQIRIRRAVRGFGGRSRAPGGSASRARS